MPPFVVGLSKIPEDLKQKLPPTDSRLRTDYPLIEQGKWKEVTPPPPGGLLAHLTW